MRRIAIVVFPGFQVLDLVVVSVFELANQQLARPAYEVSVVSEHGGAVLSSSGVRVESAPFGRTRFDTVMVTGAMTPEPSPPGLLAFLRRALASSRRLASICTGAFILAEAGVLDGRRATTHWHFAQALQRAHPAIHLEPDRIFVNDGSVWTSAGMTACIDLSLALVEEDLGVEVARAVARKMVVYHRRTGGQSQFSALLDMAPASDRIQTALAYAKKNLRQRLSVDDLAAAANLSPRQFSRAFSAETGQSPARAVEKLRVEAARELLEEGRHPIESVAAMSGFGDPERMRRAFLRTMGQPPQAVRRTARQHAAA